jgi:drug/metabolite transporter superfamily protein YnfA
MGSLDMAAEELEDGHAAEVSRILREARATLFEINQGIQVCKIMRTAARCFLKTEAAIGFALYEELLDCIEREQCYSWDPGLFVEYALHLIEVGDVEKSISGWDRAKKSFLFARRSDEATHCVCAQIAIRWKHLKSSCWLKRANGTFLFV